MRIFINYIQLPKLEINDYVFNNSSNNVWPTFKKDEAIKKKWLEVINEQNQLVKRYIEYLINQKRKGDEPFLIQIKSVISGRLKLIRDEKFKFLDEAQTIKLTDELREREIESLKKVLEIYEVSREFKNNWADTELLEKPAWYRTIEKFRIWNQNRSYPIAKIKQLLEEWEVDIDKNPGEMEFLQIDQIKTQQIQLLERTSDTITFVWRLPITIEKNEKGEEFKNRVFPSIPYYIFFLNGTFYEVLDWKQTNWETAEVIAQESIFYNGYHWLLTGGISGIIRNSPVGISEEVCSCFNTDFLNVKNKFYCNVRMTFDCWKISKKEIKNKSVIEDKSGGFSMITAGLPVKVGGSDDASLQGFFKFLDPTEEGGERREREGNIAGVMGELADLNSFGAKFLNFFRGQPGIIYLLLNRRLKTGCSWYYNQYHRSGCLDKEINQSLRFLRVDEGKWNKDRQEVELKEPDYLQFLKDEKMLENEMYHFLMEHVEVTFMWRNKPIWKGTYREISADLRVWETVSAAGNCYTVEAAGQICFSVTELVTAKIGGDDKTSSFWSTLITVTTTVAAAAATGGMAAGVAATATKAAIGGVGALASRGVSNLVNQGTGHSESSTTMTIHEFRHKYLMSGTYPLSMNLDWCNEALNRYRNMRELLGVNTSTFLNNNEFGSYLATPGFIRFSEIFSLGVIGRKREAWFRDKLLEGVFLNSKPYEHYHKKLSGTQITTSIGGTVRKDWNEMVYSEIFTIAVTNDDLSQLGGGMWIYKNSQFIVGTQGNKFSWIMDYLESNFKILNTQDPSKWVIKYPGNSIDNHRLDIPESWRDTEKNGIKTARVHYHLISYGNNGRTESKNDPIDEHWCSHVIINKFSRGNTTTITFGLVGLNVTKNATPGAENIPPSGTLPINPLAGTGGTPNPLGIQGTLPPGSDAEVLTTPDSGGLEMEPPEPEPTKEKEMPKEKERERERERVKEKVREKPKIKSKKKEGER